MEIVQGIWATVLGAAAVAPLATFGVVLVAFLTYRQRAHADRREQWWLRAQWAIDSALNDADPQRRLAGLKVLVQLIGSDLATEEDAELMSALAVGIQTQEAGDREVGDREAGRRHSVAVPASTQERILTEAGRLLEAARARAALAEKPARR